MALTTAHERDMISMRQAIARLSSIKLGPTSTPTFASMGITGLTASRLVATDASKNFSSVSNLTSWIAGTANEIAVSDDGDGTVTIGLVDPLIVSKGGSGAATFTDHSILLGSGTDAFTALGAATNGQLPIGSTGNDPVLAALTGTANQITVTNGAGSIILSTPQNTHTGATPTFAGLTISGHAVIVQTSQTPASANDVGVTGESAWDENYLYCCVSTNTWKRVALSTWGTISWIMGLPASTESNRFEWMMGSPSVNYGN